VCGPAPALTPAQFVQKEFEERELLVAARLVKMLSNLQSSGPMIPKNSQGPATPLEITNDLIQVLQEDSVFLNATQRMSDLMSTGSVDNLASKAIECLAEAFYTPTSGDKKLLEELSNILGQKGHVLHNPVLLVFLGQLIIRETWDEKLIKYVIVDAVEGMEPFLDATFDRLFLEGGLGNLFKISENFRTLIAEWNKLRTYVGPTSGLARQFLSELRAILVP
jgi:hypothetical protein